MRSRLSTPSRQNILLGVSALSRAPEAHRTWNDKSDDYTKFVLDPTR